MTDNKNSQRYRYLDVLRGLAILLVVMLHVGVLTPGLDTHRYIYAIVARLNVGMQLFFVLSGFLICASWERALHGPNAVAVYGIKRIGKIVPLYLIFLHLNLAIYFFLSANETSDQTFFATLSQTSVNLVNYIIHLFFLQGLVPEWLNSLVDGSWSIVAEVYFYILFPILLYRFCLTTLDAFKTYLVVLSIAILTAPILQMHEVGNFGFYNFIYQAPCFMVGVVVYRIINEPTAWTRLRLWSPALLAFASIVAIGLLLGNIRLMGVHNLYGLLFGILLIAICFLPARERWVDRLAFIHRIGQQSYSIFFCHLLLLWCVRHVPWVQFDSLNILQAFGLNLAVGLFGSLLLSWYFVNPIDQYFVRLAGSISNRMKLNAPTA